MSLPALGGYGTYNSGQGLPTRFRAETLWAEAILLLKQVKRGHANPGPVLSDGGRRLFSATAA